VTIGPLPPPLGHTAQQFGPSAPSIKIEVPPQLYTIEAFTQAELDSSRYEGTNGMEAGLCLLLRRLEIKLSELNSPGSAGYAADLYKEIESLTLESMRANVERESRADSRVLVQALRQTAHIHGQLDNARREAQGLLLKPENVARLRLAPR
jgi:hypothetical protein